jgi:hypothetical protein
MRTCEVYIDGGDEIVIQPDQDVTSIRLNEDEAIEMALVLLEQVRVLRQMKNSRAKAKAKKE